MDKLRTRDWIARGWGKRRIRRIHPKPIRPLRRDPLPHQLLVRAGLRKRVTCRLQGFLGNQLHQIAATVSHAKRIGGFAFIPEWAYRKVFDCTIPHRYSTEGMEVFEEDETRWCPIPPHGELVLNGFFQSYRYIEEQTVRDVLHFHPRIVDYVRARHPVVLDARSTGLHVRRGESLDPNQHMATLPSDYYERAMEQVPETGTCVVFSDDIPWCRDRFRGNRFHFIEGEENFVDLCAMSLCRNQIIANSTFSWWGAWFNEHPGKRVVAPKIWYKQESLRGVSEVIDRIPPDWITL